jgi:hypothetical protein
MPSTTPRVMTAMRMPPSLESRKRQSKRTMLTTDGNESKMRKSRSVQMQPATPMIHSKVPSMHMKTASLGFPMLKMTLQRPGRREMPRSLRKSAMPPRIAGSESVSVVALMKSSLI